MIYVILILLQYHCYKKCPLSKGNVIHTTQQNSHINQSEKEYHKKEKENLIEEEKIQQRQQQDVQGDGQIQIKESQHIESKWNVSDNPSNSTIILSEQTTLDKLYNNLSKKRKSVNLDNFGSNSDLEGSGKSNRKRLSKDFSDSFASSTSIFDESYPFLLADDNLEPTDEPLVPLKENDKTLNKQQQPRKERQNIHLPKISSLIRWDQIRNP